MIKPIAELGGTWPQDAHTLCSIAVDLRATQTVDGDKGIDRALSKLSLPKRLMLRSL